MNFLYYIPYIATKGLFWLATKTGETKKLSPRSRGVRYFSDGVTEKSFVLFMEDLKVNKSSHYNMLLISGNGAMFFLILLIITIVSKVG